MTPPHEDDRTLGAGPDARRAFGRLLATTGARLGVGRAGPRLPAGPYLALLVAHARARDAVISEVPTAFIRRLRLVEIATRARTRTDYLRRPDLGRTLAVDARARLRRCRQHPEVQLVLTDGLSSAAVMATGGAVLTLLTKKLRARGRRLGTSLFVRNGRVRVEDEIGAALRADVVCLLVGERPGLVTADSLSAYVIYRPSRRSTEPDRTVIANIHKRGLPPVRAATAIAALIDEILARRASGATLEAARGAGREIGRRIGARRDRPRNRRMGQRARAGSGSELRR